MSKLDQQYARIMENHPFGIALYRPLPQSNFKPGECGYFDNFGDWNPIGHLEETGWMTAKGLSPVEDDLEKAPVDEGISWGPKTSANMKASKVELSGGVDPVPGIPVNVSSIYSYSIDNDVGAILLTSAPITHERYYHASPFKNWVKANALSILQRWPEVKEHGLWLITSTYATKKCAINMWNSRGKGFKVGFSADSMGIIGVDTGSEWYRSQTDEGWVEYTSKENEKSVVFFGGLKFQYTRRLNGKDFKVIPKPVFRGDHRIPDDDESFVPELITSIPDPDSRDAFFVVDCEEYLGEERKREGDEW